MDHSGSLGSKQTRKARVAEIRKRFAEYMKYCNGDTPKRLAAVRELNLHAPDDIQFLLQDRKKISKLLKEARKTAANLRERIRLRKLAERRKNMQRVALKGK